MSFSHYLKYYTLLFITLFSLVSCSVKHLSDHEQNKINESILQGDLNKDNSVYFEAELVEHNTTAKTLNSGESAIHLVCKNFSPGSRYRLYVTSPGSDSLFICNLSANRKGELFIENNPKDILDGTLISLFGHMPGEEKVFTLISEDCSKYISTFGVQKPLVAVGQDGAIFKLRLMSKNADSFLIQCKGLKPYEKFCCTSKSCDEKLYWSEIADTQGNWQSMFLPAVIGHQGGLGYLEFTREDGEVLGISYAWGKNAIQITREEIEGSSTEHK